MNSIIPGSSPTFASVRVFYNMTCMSAVTVKKLRKFPNCSRFCHSVLPSVLIKFLHRTFWAKKITRHSVDMHDDKSFRMDQHFHQQLWKLRIHKITVSISKPNRNEWRMKSCAWLTEKNPTRRIRIFKIIVWCTTEFPGVLYVFTSQ